MAEELPDLLYILGDGSRWSDNEMRYSLRTCVKHFPHRMVFVVGNRPWFASPNIHHLPAYDPYAHKLKNSIHKLAIGVGCERLGNRFAVMNDDFFFLKDTPRSLPLYHRGPMTLTIERHPTNEGYYAIAKKVAMDKLKRRGISHPLDYSVHYPMIFEKDKVQEALRVFGGPGCGYLFRTCYANWFHLGGIELDDRPGMAGRCPLKLTTWRDPGDADFFSTNDAVATDEAFREWMQRKFPWPTVYEK